MACSRVRGDPVRMAEGESWTGRLMWAPADRVAGTRGPRAVPAGVVAIGALVALMLARGEGGPAWTRFAFVAAAAGLVVAAVLLWIARRPLALAIAVALIPLAVAGVVVASTARDRELHERDKWGGAVLRYEDRGRILTDAQAEAVPEGITKDELTARLGVPAGSGVQRLFGERDMRCLAYRTGKPERAGQLLHAFCFRDGRYVALRRW
jgi:hypothetical protein